MFRTPTQTSSRLRRLQRQSELTQQLSFHNEPCRYEFFAVERDKISFTIECEATQKLRY